LEEKTRTLSITNTYTTQHNALGNSPSSGALMKCFLSSSKFPNMQLNSISCHQ